MSEISADWAVAVRHDVRPCTCGKIHIVFFDKDNRLISEYALDPDATYSFAQDVLQGYDQQVGI